MSLQSKRVAYSPWFGVIVEPDFEAMSWREADAFLQELVSKIPERIGQLETRVRETSGFVTWRASGSERSFLRLGPWLKKTLKHRWLSPAEKTFVVMNPKLPRRVAADLKRRWKAERVREFMPESVSMLVDVGMYTATCLHRDFPDAQWIRYKNKGDWFNHPLLRQHTKGGFNPIMMPINCASQMLDDNRGDGSFLDLYCVWKNIFANATALRRGQQQKSRTKHSRR